MTALGMLNRRAVVRRGQQLTWMTISYNSIEAVASLIAGVLAGSVALIGFGLDSVIELSSSVASLWRLRADATPAARQRSETIALRLIGVAFLLLAVYVTIDAISALVTRESPRSSVLGIIIAAGSVVVMPLLARAKRRIAAQLASRALTADARQTQICMYLSAILLGGLVLNAVFGWWWADPMAALSMVPLIGWEGIQALRGRTVCADCCPVVDGGA